MSTNINARIRDELARKFIKNTRGTVVGRVPKELMNRARAWANTQFQSAKNVYNTSGVLPSGIKPRAPSGRVPPRVTPVATQERKRKKGSNNARLANANRYNMDTANLKKALKKFNTGVQLLPGAGRNNTAYNLLQAVLQQELAHLTTPAVRQSYSGGILETTSFAVAARAANVDVTYFADAPLNKDITNVMRMQLPRCFILKSAFSLDNTIKNSSVETDPVLFSVWKTIVGLAVTKASRTAAPNNMRQWIENNSSPFKGFKEVQPDVLEWIPGTGNGNCPNGKIRIYEMKVGIGKPEAAPAEAYQLLKARRAIQLVFIHAGLPLPCIELYFLPWMYGTPEGASGKFKNYINDNAYYGRQIWKILEPIDRDYKVHELRQDTFKQKTGLDPKIMTAVLDVFRSDQVNKVLRLMTHIKRHRIGFRSMNFNTRQAALRGSKNEGLPKREAKQSNVLRSKLAGIIPRNRIPPGMNNLAALVLNPELVSANTAKERGNIVQRAVEMIGYRNGSKYFTFNRRNGKIIGNPGGVSVNNLYFSNNDNNQNKLNNRNLQRIKAGFAKYNTLPKIHQRVLDNFNIYNKFGVPVPGASHPNARVLAQVVANRENFTDAYGRFLTSLSALPENQRTRLKTNFKNQLNQLAAAQPNKYVNKRNYVATMIARGR